MEERQQSPSADGTPAQSGHSTRNIILPYGGALPEASLESYMHSPDALRAASQGETVYIDYIARHGALKHLLTDQAAQDAFAHGGEAGYQEHVRRERMRLLRGWPWPASGSTPPGQSASNKAPRPKQAKPATPAGGQAGGRSNRPSAANQQGPPLTPDIGRRQAALGDVMDGYARLVAKQRSTHLDAMLDGRRVWQVAKQVLSPLSYRRAEQLRVRTAAARATYKTSLDNYVDAVGGSDQDKIRTKLEAMAAFERRVVECQIEATHFAPQVQPGMRGPNRADQTRRRITQFWLTHRRLPKAAVVAVPAAAVGLGIGALVFAWGLPAIATTGAGIAAAYAGRSIGGGIASTVNQYKIATPIGYQEAADGAERRKLAFAQQYTALKLAGHSVSVSDADVTTAYEQGTKLAAHNNARRRGLAQLVGGLAAAAGFGAGGFTAEQAREAFSQAHNVSPSAIEPTPTPAQTAPPPPHTPPPTPTPTPPRPPVECINPNQYPWSVAHDLSPGHEWEVIRHAINQYNACFHTHMHLVTQPNGKVWLENGAQALDAAQQRKFNIFMELLSKAKSL